MLRGELGNPQNTVDTMYNNMLYSVFGLREIVLAKQERGKIQSGTLSALMTMNRLRESRVQSLQERSESYSASRQVGV